jgi:hypothetical protein
MSAVISYDDAKRGILLPQGWQRAPVEFWKRDKLSALVFFVVNFFFGTTGIWLPLVNALFGTRPFSEELEGLFESGTLYLYSLAFLATIAGTTFTSLVKDNKEHTRSLKTVLAGCSGVSIFLCTVFLQIQLSIRNAECLPSWITWANYGAQLLLSAIAVVVAVYVHSIIFNEETGSPKSDLDRGAKEMLQRSQMAGEAVKLKDFES